MLEGWEVGVPKEKAPAWGDGAPKPDGMAPAVRALNGAAGWVDGLAKGEVDWLDV